MLKTKQVKSLETRLETHNLAPATTGWVYIVSKLSLSIIIIVYAGIASVKVEKF